MPAPLSVPEQTGAIETLAAVFRAVPAIPIIAEAARAPVTLIFFETAPRLLESLQDLLAVLGDRPAAVARELTKLFEEVRRGTLAELAARYAAEPFCVVLPFGELPAMSHVQGSNFVHLGVTGDRVAGRALVVSTLDNLNKGAAGGAMQWLNRLLGFDETAGLTAPAAGWT